MSGYKCESRINRTHFKKVRMSQNALLEKDYGSTVVGSEIASSVISSAKLQCRIGGGPYSKGAAEPNGEYDRADEPAGRHRPISPRCDCDNSPVGLTNEPTRESGSLQLELLLILLSPGRNQLLT
ncbi:hypothetical protein T08_10311 [Trichinella sp. T8]|nr:hypothetical protein T08_10311 [Trichinella sp. T8]